MKFIIITQSILLVLSSWYVYSLYHNSWTRGIEEKFKITEVMDFSIMVCPFLLILIFWKPYISQRWRFRPLIIVAYTVCEAGLTGYICSYYLSMDLTFYLLGVASMVWKNAFFSRVMFFDIERNPNRPKLVGNTYTCLLF